MYSIALTADLAYTLAFTQDADYTLSLSQDTGYSLAFAEWYVDTLYYLLLEDGTILLAQDDAGIEQEH